MDDGTHGRVIGWHLLSKVGPLILDKRRQRANRAEVREPRCQAES